MKNEFLDGRWRPEDAAQLYGMPDWGLGYFGVNDRGHAVVMPTRVPGTQADLKDVVDGLAARGYRTPVLLRFGGILADRLGQIRGAFDRAIADAGYKGGYIGVYPIKVNQQRHVCEELASIGDKLGFGLEAGSKPELLAVLALTAGRERMPIICNGFKDEEFVETVLLAQKLGRNIYPIVEKSTELESIVRQAGSIGVRPRIGVRVKLSARGAGRWETSAGARSKFGLFVSEVLDAMEYLREHGMTDCLKVLHCHIGSQVYDIRQVKSAVNELAHIYAELVRLGAGLEMLNVGGGLGVDYDGSQSAWESSINYSINEYADDIVARVMTVCDDAGVAHPTIISESGRAMVAYGSVLVCDVIGSTGFDAEPDLERIRADMQREDEVPQPVLDLVDAHERLNDRTVMEVYNDALQARDEAMSLFNLGYMSLPMRAASERLFWSIGRRVLGISTKTGELNEELEGLPRLLSDIYFCNFSVFQSMPDAWAIDQLFPICPIHRLGEQPTRRGVLADITCDSDGKVDSFVDKRVDKRVLELHQLTEGEPYYLGVFLVGAYQEILGDLHNLIGDTHAVHIGVGGDGTWEIEEIVEGDTVKDVLGYVQFDHNQMRRVMRMDVERSIRAGRVSTEEGRSFLRHYEHGLDGYTYLE